MQENEQVLIASWRNIPDADTLMTFLNNPIQLASILATETNNSPSDIRIAVDSNTSCLLETDTSSLPSSVEYKSLKDLYCVTSNLFNVLPVDYPFTRPTSLIQMLHRANQVCPNKIQVFSERESNEFRNVYLQLMRPLPLEDNHLTLFVEDSLNNSVTILSDLVPTFRCRCRVQSTLRYCYGV